jgi:hypothetical protein
MKGYVNDELAKISKEAVVAYIKTLNRHLPGQTEKTRNFSQDSRDLIPGSPEYEAGVLTTTPRRLTAFTSHWFRKLTILYIL